ncbi:uncharacterized protein EHS24_008607 [Apiotrichum porosum]|uniref:Outer spore wall protein lds1 n=1 Tax=Apiotrichum porosum TaxID=105984 RepID=A0A427XQS0_9TREE|nr:uncharacterized protein EHS24_008607 [Apiotrichum porosum]RSH81170.1 hypothetical protein EHS24_008607 [Apiotrichum porosum]
MAMPQPADAKIPIHMRVVHSAQRQVMTAGEMTRDAVWSGAWAYPFWGAMYICTHPSLLTPAAPLLVRAVLISLAVVAACFFFLYLPQVAWLSLFSGPLDLLAFARRFGDTGVKIYGILTDYAAFAAAVPLVLAEASVILGFLGKNFLMGQLGMDLFDAVLVQKGHIALVEKSRPVVKKANNARQLGRVLSRPLAKLSVDNMVRYLLTLPLNLIPVVGTVFFLGYNGYKAGPSYHARYFMLKGWDKSRSNAYVDRHRGSYTAFGVTAAAFNLIPVVSIILGLACNVGAGLWAADIENTHKSVHESVAPPHYEEYGVSIPPPE